MISLQVKFSIKTFQTQISESDRIYVVTDSPAVYDNVPGINIISVNSREIAEWKGKHNFFWRSKIMAMRMIAEKYPNDHLMYLDGDTFLKGSLDRVKTALDEGKAMMHLDEGCPGTRKRYGHYKMWEQINGNTFGGITIDSNYHMWNAGVVAISAKNLKSTLDTAISVCDDMLDAGVEQVVIEQYALSVGLYTHGKEMLAAERIISHYWHYKYEWCCYISKFFALSYVKKRKHEEELDVLRKISLPSIERFLRIKRTLKKLVGKKR